MPKPVTKIRTAFGSLWQGVKSAWNDIGFGRDISSRGGNSRYFYNPTTGIDFAKEVGDLWEVPAIAAALNWIGNNINQCPPQVEEEKEEEWEAVKKHELSRLLKNPNEFYDGCALLFGIICSWYSDGNAYIGIETDRAGTPLKLWFLPHMCITPKRHKGSRNLIDYYEYKVGGKTQIIPMEEMLHLRCGMDIYNPAKGKGALAAAPAPAYATQKGSAYTANILRNGGAVSVMIAPKETSDTFDDPEGVAAKYRAKTTGDRVGEAFVLTGSAELTPIGSTPQDMALETIEDRPEALIAALFGLPAQVFGLHVGRQSKTYANQSEARESAWEECLLPLLAQLALQIGNKLLPRYGNDTDTFRLCFDTSEVRPLQPDLDALYVRANAAFALNLIDRYQWKIMVGMKPDDADKGVYNTTLQVEQANAMPQPQLPNTPPTRKALLDWYTGEIHDSRNGNGKSAYTEA